MKSIRELYRIGNGPSSSHTIGPRRAAEIFKERHPQGEYFEVTLYGSLAATGKGHMTDKGIQQAMDPMPVKFLWKPDEKLPLHPNGMQFRAYGQNKTDLGVWEVYSPGGGALQDDEDINNAEHLYKLYRMKDILAYCNQTGKGLWEYVEEVEDGAIWDFLGEIWDAMKAAIERGINREGVLPGGLGVSRKAWAFYRKTYISGSDFIQHNYLSAYALGVAEENASGEIIVTAPTSGASGVLPAVLRYVQENTNCPRESILHALATAGLIGNLVKHNASISGAEVGCQGEIGTACAMAAAAATQLLGGTNRQIEYAAEMGVEHHLGLTCDPVGGLVQIPCIERNVFAATRAMSCANYALFSDGSHLISFDEAVEVMKQTGHDLPPLYRETADGGLAKAFRKPNSTTSP